MNKMTGIILMLIGFVILVAGAIIYTTSTKKEKINLSNDNGSELNKVIEMAIADGVLTANERNIIKQIATEKELDYEAIITDVEKQIAESETDSETEIIDYTKKKGDDFEKFIAQKFNKRFFRITEWAGDKYINGVYADTTPQPDIQLAFRLKNETSTFSVECKWRQNLYRNGVEIAEEEKFERYKEFEKTKETPVFIAIGIGGKAMLPDQLFIVPLQAINSNFIPIKALKRYKKKVDSDFFFDAKTKELR